MKQHYGWRGKVLSINLSDRSYHVIKPEAEIYKNFIGGRGLAGCYLRPFCHLPWDSPEMPLLFFAGPLCGTKSPSSGMISVVSVSPLSGAVTDSSVCGNFGTELKRAGWDGIIITGNSPELCGIIIKDNHIDIIKAEEYRGKTLSEVIRDLIRQTMRQNTQKILEATNGIYGLWEDREMDVDDYIRSMRQDRTYGHD